MFNSLLSSADGTSFLSTSPLSDTLVVEYMPAVKNYRFFSLEPLQTYTALVLLVVV